MHTGLNRTNYIVSIVQKIWLILVSHDLTLYYTHSHTHTPYHNTDYYTISYHMSTITPYHILTLCWENVKFCHSQGAILPRTHILSPSSEPGGETERSERSERSDRKPRGQMDGLVGDGTKTAEKLQKNGKGAIRNNKEQ